MKRFVLLLLSACQADLPDIPPERFACTVRLRRSQLQCPQSHWCKDERCSPRLGCTEPLATEPACPDGVSRCEPELNGEVAAMSCEPGLYTLTSTTPIDPERCTCPEPFLCVAFAEGPTRDREAYPLFVLPPGDAPVSLPSGSFGISGERTELRVCSRACSSELDCPAEHTCRAAAVIQSGLVDNPVSTRHTIGVCYPNRLMTVTASSAAQPDQSFCADIGDCGPFLGRPVGVCQAQTILIPDHPTVPAGPAWGTRTAVIQRCVQQTGGLIPPGRGCTRTDLCETGICFEFNCAILCNPEEIEPCTGNRACFPATVERQAPGGQAPQPDLIHICRNR